ncbi:hypothetical protein [Bradyrhizobium sp. 2S1]|uniref:hypothetical protein n=1 Tax=Bradyrhizobium sp. 2S1 TaxID=1404429 RepID=UPI0014075BD3|nr:hypothetical protein [Bradyrhizobium sp. 2S1]MCK7669174.1 hypothetical protein [Bradyrhizobium sp. 2S1]
MAKKSNAKLTPTQKRELVLKVERSLLKNKFYQDFRLKHRPHNSAEARKAILWTIRDLEADGSLKQTSIYHIGHFTASALV